MAQIIRWTARSPRTLLLALLIATGGGIALAASIASARSGGPRCVPHTLDASDLLRGTTVGVSPLPGSYDASPLTQVSFVGVPAADIQHLTVAGSRSGIHGGRLEPYSQGDGASFVPDSPFRAGETVRVRGEIATAAGGRPFAFRFVVAHPDVIAALPPGERISLGGGSAEYQSFRSAPGLHPPKVSVTVFARSAKPGGEIFAAPYDGAGSTGPMIFEPDGQLIWMRPLPEDVDATNLQVQELNGKRVLTWWQGYVPKNGFGLGEEIVANSAYRTIMHVKAGNGYEADLHDFRIERGGTAVLTAFSTIRCNLSSIGGPSNGDVTNASFQELDLKTGLVRREWTGLDHVALRASYSSPRDASSSWPFDYLHINTIDPRSDGTTLLSARNTSALYVIDDETGQIITTIGGRKPTVRMEPSAQTAYQHDATTLPDGEISIFDNGGSPFEHPQSRALIIALAHGGTVDTVVRELTHSPPLRSSSQGSVQLLGGGDWFVGWGSNAYFSEFTPGGRLIYDSHLAGASTASYRGYRFPWHGMPASRPSIATAHTKGSGIEVYASWNGATGVASWQLLAGASRGRLREIATVERTGFETAMSAPSARCLQVRAVSGSGRPLRSSRIVCS